VSRRKEKKERRKALSGIFFSTLPLICIFLALDDDDDDYIKYSMGLLHSCLLLFSFFHGIDDTKNTNEKKSVDCLRAQLHVRSSNIKKKLYDLLQ